MVSSEAKETISIERDGEILRCMASPASPWPVIAAAAGVGVILLVPLVQLIVTAHKQAARRHPDYTSTWFFGTMWFVVVAVVFYFVWLAVKRQQLPRGLVIDALEVRVFSPEQGQSEQVFDRANLRGAPMEGMGSRSLTRYASLMLIWHDRGATLALLKHPAADVKRVVDAINALVLITDRHTGFEVVMPVIPITGAMPILPHRADEPHD